MRGALKYDYRNDPMVKEIVTSLKKKLGEHLKSMILFGSRARGDATADSDYDILLLVDEHGKEFRDGIRDVENYMLDNHDVFVMALDYTSIDFEEREFTPLFINVRKEGIPIYG